MLNDPEVLIDDFRKVAGLAGVSMSHTALSVETLPAPHRPPSALPRGKMAVYAFVWKGQCLKVGKVGPNSHARYTSQHYSPSSSNSNLAQSILSARHKLGLVDVSEASVGSWIKTNVDRYNFLLDSLYIRDFRADAPRVFSPVSVTAKIRGVRESAMRSSPNTRFQRIGCAHR